MGAPRPAGPRPLATASPRPSPDLNSSNGGVEEESSSARARGEGLPDGMGGYFSWAFPASASAPCVAVPTETRTAQDWTAQQETTYSPQRTVLPQRTGRSPRQEQGKGLMHDEQQWLQSNDTKFGTPPPHDQTGMTSDTSMRREPVENMTYVPGQSARAGGAARGSAFLHKGFFDILSLANDRQAGPQNGDGDFAYPNHPSKFRSTVSRATDAFRRNSRIPAQRPISSLMPADMASKNLQDSDILLCPTPVPLPSPSQAVPGPRVAKKRISVNMVSAPRPESFVHAAHASDEQEALAILQRWSVDDIGKVADPTWVEPIKEALRSQAAKTQAEAVAQVQANLHGESDFRYAPRPPLQIVNGLPSTSTVATLATLGLPTASDLGTLGQESGTPYQGRTDGHQACVGFSTDTTDQATIRNADREVIAALSSPYKTQSSSTVDFDRPQLPRTNTAGTTFVATPLATLQEAPDYMQYGQVDNDQTIRRTTVPGLPITTDSPAPRLAINKLFDPPEARPSSVVLTEEIDLEGVAPAALRDSQLSRPAAYTAEAFHIRPTLTTVEKSVAAKIFFENHYYGILKKPAARETRRAGLERDLAALRVPEASKEALRQAWIARETEHLRALRARVSANSFVKLKTIGHGAFGVVALVRERESGQLYAMKQLRKTDMLRKGQEGHVRAERDLMTSASGSGSDSRRWIVNLIYSFQDTDHLYLIMEFMGGGDLLNLLIEKDIFKEDFARFYIAEMIMAIHEAHRLGYIHRDIKPDNFLFTSNGHIKLADFGLCQSFHWAHDGAYYEQQRRNLLHKHGIDLEDAGGGAGAGRQRAHSGTIRAAKGAEPESKTSDRDADGTPLTHVLTYRDKQRRQTAYSVVGTNNYMAPEVLRGRGYDGACDWWSLGVIAYECLYGYPPFVSKSRQLTRQKIVNWQQHLKFPLKPRVSREAQDFIARLLCEKDDRLGSQSSASVNRPNSILLNARRQSGFAGGTATSSSGLIDGVEELMSHAWFKGIDWTTLHKQDPPYKPALAHPADTKHFDDDIDDEPLPNAATVAAKEAGVAPPTEVARDPMLRDAAHGERLLEMRKALAFVGYTFKRPPGFDLAGMREEDIDQALGLGQVNKEKRQGSRLLMPGAESGSRIRAMSM
ncbi:kinase-like protein [Microstroma glucosiphilum]|uniref:non-specific serine/threonine protein kinase n=1 Tax=Pseudomicrostroma glucosiphilum TaxID=1684307 RepID=A0A316U9J6_9BASI|nr:kinase-like protein [Pseudomicrostroma glucosiphilum]PWN21829.1 kinase-like protein [Pseudomicrostroma glucosiphilum]